MHRHHRDGSNTEQLLSVYTPTFCCTAATFTKKKTTTVPTDDDGDSDTPCTEMRTCDVHHATGDNMRWRYFPACSFFVLCWARLLLVKCVLCCELAANLIYPRLCAMPLTIYTHISIMHSERTRIFHWAFLFKFNNFAGSKWPMRSFRMYVNVFAYKTTNAKMLSCTTYKTIRFVTVSCNNLTWDLFRI